MWIYYVDDDDGDDDKSYKNDVLIECEHKKCACQWKCNEIWNIVAWK